MIAAMTGSTLPAKRSSTKCVPNSPMFSANDGDVETDEEHAAAARASTGARRSASPGTRPKAPPLDRSNSSSRYWPAANVSVTNPRSMQKSSTGRAPQLEADREQRDDREDAHPSQCDELVVAVAEAEALPHRREADVHREQDES